MYSNSLKTVFDNIIDYNENNIVSEFGLTNVCYFLFFDPKNKDITDSFKYLEDKVNTNPLDLKCVTNIEIEQKYFLDFSVKSYKTIENDINHIIEMSNESDDKIVLFLDIEYLFGLIKDAFENDYEIHLYDFLIYNFKKKLDNIFIYDKYSSLLINNNKNCAYDELFTLLKSNTIKTIDKLYDVQIYKYYDSLYWNILLDTDVIEYENINDIIYDINMNNDINNGVSNDTYYSRVNDNYALISKINVEKLCYSNLLNMHNIVLNPLDKLKLISFYK